MLWVFQPYLRPIGEKPWEEVPLDGIKLARLVFRHLPEEWEHSGPSFCEGAGYIGETWENLELGFVKRWWDIMVSKYYNLEWRTYLETEKRLVSGQLKICLSVYYPENPWYEKIVDKPATQGSSTYSNSGFSVDGTRTPRTTT